MAHQPGCRIVALRLFLNHTDRKQTAATSSITPPPKKPATCGIDFNAPATNRMRLITVAAIAVKNTYDFAGRNVSVLSVLPAIKLRVDERPTLLNVRNIQTTAAAIPPTAPRMSDCHDM